MRLSFRLKHRFFNAFREFFVHHHGSLEFRAKLFALMIAANEKSNADSYVLVKELAMQIYEGDEERADLLMLTTKEKVDQVKEDNGLDIDTLICNIQKDLHFAPRYAKKINIDDLKKLIPLSYDEDTISYQENIIEFLENLRRDILKEKKVQIAEDESVLATG